VQFETLLIALVALPFAGSCLAAVLPANARNAEAWLAGAFAFVALILVLAAYPGVVDGGVIRLSMEWVSVCLAEQTARIEKQGQNWRSSLHFGRYQGICRGDRFDLGCIHHRALVH
jgi:hypothetical protein